MIDALSKGGQGQDVLAVRPEMGQSPSTQETLTHIYLLQALRQEEILFWFSLVAALVATVFQLCVICCAVAHSHTEMQTVWRLLISLSFNTVAVVAYRQAREGRRWASSLLIETQKIHQTASGPKGPGGPVYPLLRTKE
jgi:hypothetical protein